MDFEIIRDKQALDSLAEEWDAFLLRAQGVTLYQTFAWHKAWCESFLDGEERGLAMVLGRVDGKLIAIAPMCLAERRCNGIKERFLEFIGTEDFASDYADFIIDKEYVVLLPVLLDYLSKEFNWTVARFFNLPSSSPHLAILIRWAKDNELRFAQRIIYDAPSCLLNDAEHNKKILAKKSLKRYTNLLKRQGKLEFQILRAKEMVEENLDSFFDMHAKRWDSFKDDKYREYYRHIVDKLVPHGWLHFSRLSLDGVVIAYHFGFQYDNRLIWYKPCFASRYSYASPGEVLLRHLLQHAIENGFSEFDFTVGNEPYKYRFANLIRTNTEVVVYRRMHSALLAYLRGWVGWLKRQALDH